jgi:hypothetical protein
MTVILDVNEKCVWPEVGGLVVPEGLVEGTRVNDVLDGEGPELRAGVRRLEAAQVRLDSVDRLRNHLLGRS